ncbi:hypothetical protein FBUS_08199 [Fasciolopsis buskii]|uniref:Uncharacterized protein n=1 Tax=Fasciolopsis buskii TaxID=27845 RepID=A0A8E0S8A3_9TREM|nr:hypothetical protein FBUS_08199 [Fasciolopsis buski]
MNDYSNRVGRSSTSYTLSQLCESSTRLSRSRYQAGLRSAHSIQVPHVDTPNPIRRSATLEGRTRLICITPSSTRESWLKRAQSPSVSSSPSNNMEPVSAPFPNSHSDGALMKRLVRGAGIRGAAKSKSPYRTRFGGQISNSHTSELSENGVSPSASNDLEDSFRVSADRTVSRSSKISEPVQNITRRTQGPVNRPTLHPPIMHISRPSVPNLKQEPVDQSGEARCVTASEELESPRMRSSQSDQLVNEVKHVNRGNSRKFTSDVSSSIKPSKADFSPKQSRSIRKPRLMFTRALLEEKSSPLIKYCYVHSKEHFIANGKSLL